MDVNNILYIDLTLRVLCDSRQWCPGVKLLCSRNQYQIVLKKSGQMSALSYGLMIYFTWVENALRMFLGVNVQRVECNLRCPNSIYVGLHIV